MSLLDKFARIRRIVPTDMPALEALAKADNHQLVLPTHVIEKDHTMVGFISMGVIPNVFVWMSTRAMKPRDSASVINFIDNMMTDAARPIYIIPCHKSSPFFPHARHEEEYLDMGQTNLFLKQPKA